MRISDWSSDVCSSDLPIATVSQTWAPLAKNADDVIASEAAVLALAGNANRFTQGIPQLQAQLDGVVRAMSSRGSPSRSEGRSVGNEVGSTVSSRWSPCH